MKRWSFALIVTTLLFAATASFAIATDGGKGLPPVNWGDWKIEVNEYGNLKRIFLARGWDNIDELEKKVKESGVEPNIWKAALVLPLDLSAEWKDTDGNTHTTRDTFPPEEVQFIKQEYAKLEKLVYVCSGGNLKFDSEVIILEKPIKITSNKDFFFPAPFKKELLELPQWKPEETDSVICIFPPGEIPLDAFGRSWGDLHGENKSGNANIGFVRQRLEDGADLSVVMQHEWQHQAECVMFAHQGYTGVPHLHDAGQNGYLNTDNEAKQWLAWNTDLMYWFYRPAMWQRADMNSRISVKRHPKFDDGFIKEWLVLGPFPDEKREGLDLPFIKREGKIAPSKGDKGPGGKKWKLIVSDEPVVTLGQHFDQNTNVVAYAHSYIFSPVTREAILWLGSDDGAKVYLNGLEVYKNKINRGAKPDNDSLPIILKKGWNRLLFKVNQGEGGWGLCARISGKEHEELPDIKSMPLKPEKNIVKKGEIVPFKLEGKFYSWDNVSYDAYAELPELTLKHLQVITDNSNLAFKSNPPQLVLDPGSDTKRFFTTVSEPDPNDFTLNNQLNSRQESLAVLRFKTDRKDPRFPKGICDMLLIRSDLISPWMDFLQSASEIPVKDSLIGFLQVKKQSAYVFLTYLGEELPKREIDLLTLEKDGLKLSTRFLPTRVFTGEYTSLVVTLNNASKTTVTDGIVSVSSDKGGILNDGIISKNIGDLAPGKTRSVRFVIGGKGNLPVGTSFAEIEVAGSNNGKKILLKKASPLTVINPVGIDFEVDGSSIVRQGTKRKVKVVLKNNIGKAMKGVVEVFGWNGAIVTPKAMPVRLPANHDDVVLEFGVEFAGPGNRNASITARFSKPGQNQLLVTSTKLIEMGGDVLFKDTFDTGIGPWKRRIGGYSIEHITGEKAISGGSVLIKDGGGSKYGNIVIFGPERDAERNLTRTYSLKDYPIIEFDLATDSTSNSGIIVKADGESYVITTTGKFVEQWGTRKEIGHLQIPADGTPHHIRFNLEDALSAVLEDGAADHKIELIWFGDTKSHSSNQWVGEDIGRYIFDNFSIHE